MFVKRKTLSGLFVILFSCFIFCNPLASYSGFGKDLAYGLAIDLAVKAIVYGCEKGYEWYTNEEKDKKTENVNVNNQNNSEIQEFSYLWGMNYIHFKIKANSLPSSAKICIYRETKLVNSFKIRETKKGYFEYIWDLKDNNGEKIENGFYEAKIEDGYIIKTVKATLGLSVFY